MDVQTGVCQVLPSGLNIFDVSGTFMCSQPWHFVQENA